MARDLDAIHLQDYGIEEQVVKLRNKDMKWDEIAEKLETSVGKCLAAHLKATLDPKEKVKGDFEKRSGKVVELRDRPLSWIEVAVRVDLPESRCRLIYTEQTEKDTKGLRIGKGGRYPNGVEKPERPVKEKKVRAEKAEKPAKASKAKAEPAKTEKGAVAKKIVDMNLAEIKEKLTGKAILVNRKGGKQEKVKVKSVKSLKDGNVELTNDAGASRTIPVSTIAKVGKA